VAQYIERCLISAFDQTYPDIEYILVNDATPDDSMSIAAKVIREHGSGKRVKLTEHTENRGLSAARNTGIDEATGDYLFFLDSDDELPPDSIASFVTAAERHNPDFVIGEIAVIGANNKSFPPLKPADGFYCEGDEVMRLFLSRQWYEMAWNKLVKRTLFAGNDCRFREGILHEDNLWSFHLALCAKSMTVIRKKTYIYHINSQSITQKKTERNSESLYTALSEMMRTAQEQNLFSKYDKLIDYLENLRIYFLKTLIKGGFEKSYIRRQKGRIDLLFDTVGNRGRRSIANTLKNLILTLWIQLL
jgi:glycosyltransferase involved in cell wall biosynthesis